MEDKITIYIAGNPDAYPIEYYDKESQAFKGVIPSLLEDFSKQSSYDIIYYDADSKDNREDLAKNNQVDIISANTSEEISVDRANAISMFKAEDENGEDISYYLSFTNAAPDGLKTELKDFITSVSQQEVNNLLVEMAQITPGQEVYPKIAAGLIGVIVGLIILIVLLVRSYRIKLKKALQDVETDETTGLGNLEYMRRYYSQFINDKNRILYNLVYFYVDTDRLRKIGNSRETEEFLRYCAVILKEYTGDTDILAKVSDQGFVILKQSYDNEKTDEWIMAILKRIRSYTQQYSKPFESDMNVGIYPMKQQDRDLDEMIFHASQGAYMAAKEGVDYVYCSEQMLQKCIQERQLQSKAEEAFEKHQFKLYIQFYVDSDTGSIVGGEALSRWHHPQKGILSPSEFVPFMERENMISSLDFYCLKEVCEFLQEMAKNNIKTFFISCNFSRGTFASPEFPERVKEILQQYNFPRELLIFEITESEETKDVLQMQENISELKKFGVSVVLDDFGEGFTSFYDLQKYNIDGVKLDKGLVDQILTPRGKTILKYMVKVGHELQITILAEGVENEEQVNVLQEIGCDVIQGYYFYYPMPDWEAKTKILQQFSGCA